MRLRLTVVCEYNVKPEHYGTSDPVEMAQIDLHNYTDDPTTVLEALEHHDHAVRVEPVP